MRPGRTKNTSVCRDHTPENATKDERRRVETSRSEQVETYLDRFIGRRDTERRKTEGERLEET